MDNTIGVMMVPEQATNVVGFAGEPLRCSPSWEMSQIKKCENGFVVNVGCKTFVFMDWTSAHEALNEYWADPIAARKKYCKEG